MQPVWPRAEKAIGSRGFVFGSITLAVAAVWWLNVRHLEPWIAIYGFSPIGWVHEVLRPADFERNFPSGIANYSKSAFMHVYTAAATAGVPPEALIKLVIGLEVAVLSWAIYTLFRELLPDASPVVGIAMVVLAIASSARNMNLAHFAQPFFVGQFYNVADVLRLFAIVMVLRRRLIAAALLLAACFMTHPTMGLMGAVFVAAMLLAKPQELMRPATVVAAAVFALVTGGWFLSQFREATMSGGQIPVTEWIELTKMLNIHWYPIDNGMLDREPHLVLLPFLSFLLLLAYCWPAIVATIDRRVLGGLGAMLALSIAGLVISACVPVPLLIKLALHRANDLVVLIGLVYVVAKLCRDVTEAAWWQRALAATLLLSPWTAQPAFPVVLALAATAPAWLRVALRRRPTRADYTVAALAAIFALFTLFMLVRGGGEVLRLTHVFGNPTTLVVLAVSAVFALVGGRVLHPRLFGAALAIGGIAACALWYARAAPPASQLAYMRSYMQAQLWARDHTPVGSLFMPDPTMFYGWRDYSQRSSFGNLHEWLHTSWLYDSNYDRYRAGMQRFNEFGVELDPHLRARPPIAGMGPVTLAVRRHYYDAPDEWRISLAERYGIDYFVFRRAEMKPTTLTVVFANEHFVIAQAPR